MIVSCIRKNENDDDDKTTTTRPPPTDDGTKTTNDYNRHKTSGDEDNDKSKNEKFHGETMTVTTTITRKDGESRKTIIQTIVIITKSIVIFIYIRL